MESWRANEILKVLICVCVCYVRTPLMLAVLGGHVDAVSLLLEREASVDTADNQGLTALHLGVCALTLNYPSGTAAVYLPPTLSVLLPVNNISSIIT